MKVHDQLIHARHEEPLRVPARTRREAKAPLAQTTTRAYTGRAVVTTTAY